MLSKLEKNKKKRIIVLGRNGFIAKNLIKLLKKKRINYLAFSKKRLNLEKKISVNFLQKIVKPTDQIVFISAVAPVKNNLMLKKNVLILNNVVEALRNIKFSQILYISSDAVYDDNARVINENTARTPVSLHGNMHLIRENTLKNFFEDKLCIVRPTLIYGKNDPHNGYGPNKFLRQVMNLEDISLFGMGEEKRDHICVTDVVNVIYYCLQNNFRGCLNIASGKILSFMNIARECLKRNKKIKIKLIPRNGPMPHGGYRKFNIRKLKKYINVEKFTKLQNYIKSY